MLFLGGAAEILHKSIFNDIFSFKNSHIVKPINKRINVFINFFFFKKTVNSLLLL